MPDPAARYDIVEAATVLRMSRAQLYKRIRAGEIHAQRDGKRRYISAAAIAEYVERLDALERAPDNDARCA